MSFNQLDIPISGGSVLAIGIYAALSYFLTSQIVGERTIERSGWLLQCERSVISTIRNDTPDLKTTVQVPDCESIMGLFAGRDSRGLCDKIGFVFKNPVATQIEQQNRRLNKIYHNKVVRSAMRANSQCKCAINVTLENRLPWSMYAGSMRLIKPSPVANFEAELTRALSSQYCRGEIQ